MSTDGKPKPISAIETSQLGRKSKLQYLLEHEYELYQQIIRMLELGVFDYVACEAFGISHSTFIVWMRKGAKAREGIYRTFYLDVSGATARARVLAEMEVKREDPKFWLRFGPGKSRTRAGVYREGWSDSNILPGADGTLTEIPSSGQAVKTNREEEVNQLAQVLVVLEEIGVIPAELAEGGPVADSPEVRSPEPPRLPNAASGNGNGQT